MKITFGKYLFRDSWLHHFDGRLKFLSFLLFLSVIFVKSNFIPYFILLLLFLLLFFIAKLPKIILWQILQPVFFMLIFLFLFNMVNIDLKGTASDSNAKDLLWHWRFLKITYSGLIFTFYYSLRVFLVILLTVLLVSTTKPKTLTLSIESLLQPLCLIRLPIHIFSMIISLTLRLVPTLIEEARSIMEAQASRGLDFKNSNLKKKLKVLISLLIPLIISIFKRADEMAMAMESRGYNPSQSRSRYQQFVFLRSNWIWFGLVLSLFLGIIFYLTLTPDSELINQFILNKYLIQKVH